MLEAVYHFFGRLAVEAVYIGLFALFVGVPFHFYENYRMRKIYGKDWKAPRP